MRPLFLIAIVGATLAFPIAVQAQGVPGGFYHVCRRGTELPALSVQS